MVGVPWLVCSLLLYALPASGCPSLCSCSSGTVVCTGYGLRKIPSGIPKDTTRLDLQENKISVIRRHDLIGLPHLKILQLSDNDILSIDPGAFDELHSLERIRLNNNKLRELPLALFTLNRMLYRIDLSHNQLSVIAEDHLRGPRGVRNLQLDNNLLTCFESSIVNEWPNLEVLTLNNNNLSTIEEFEVLPTLRHLKLGDNPWLCDCRLRWLKRLDASASVKCHRPALVQGRHLDSVDDQLIKCSGMEKRATSSCLDQRRCPATCTCVDTVVDCRDRGFTHVPSHLPPSTTELRLEQNQITYLPQNAFATLKNLKRLDLSKNLISEIAPRAFEGLTQLNSLVLYGNDLVDIPESTFEGLVNLQLLLLNANRLQCVRRDTFKPLTKLTLLSLYDNQIKSLSNETLHHLTMLQTLHLAKNPLICDCNLEWLAQLLKTRMIETTGARCEGPKRVAKRRLSTLQPAKFRCRGSEFFVTKGSDECVIDHECPEECSCQGTSVDCSHRSLSFIPMNIPSFTTDLRLNHNKFSSLAILANQSLPNLRALDLASNEFSVIPPNTFSNMPSLTNLNLNDNKIRSFAQGIVENPKKKPRTITLLGNNIECFTEEVLQHIDPATTIDLPKEVYCSCDVKGLATYVQNQSLASPRCSGPPQLLGAKLADLTAEQLKCTGEETGCASGERCPRGCSCEGTIVRCSNKALTSFPSNIPDDTTELFLDSNEIQSVPVEALSKLTKLTKLDLSHNAIVSIEDFTFSNLTALSTLILSYNKLQCLSPHAFAALNNLRILSLHGNDLSTLPETAFADLGNITHIALGSNSLHCDCDLAWFARWIKVRFIEAGIARCESPTSLRNQLLLSAPEGELVCAAEKPMSVLAKCDACAESPCNNGARCEKTRGRQYKCHCAMGFHGEKCEKEIDACYGHPCMNNASCKVIEEGRFSCVCAKGFKGQLCEENIDDCASNKCEHGSKCVDMINSYRCECGERYAGRYCEERLSFCTKRLQPCKNGGSCLALNKGEDYQCKCLPGFSGRNCTENIDDCKHDKCQNGASCLDGVNSYTCECSPQFTGSHCEIALMGYSVYQSAAACERTSCNNGECVFLSDHQPLLHEGNDSSMAECRCHAGWTGDKCDILRSIGFSEEGSFASLDPWLPDSGRLSLTLTTTANTGLIAYVGDESSHLSIELFDGRVKISFYIGNAPASHMYSYALVNDGLPHKLVVSVEGDKLTLIIDATTPQHIENSGKSKKFHAKSKLPLFLGGLPEDVAILASSMHHTRHTASFKGCVTDVLVNESPVDFAKATLTSTVHKGCSSVVDVCSGVDCGKGTCVANATIPNGFTCRCDAGFSGPLCADREIGCMKERWRKRLEIDDCISVDEIKSATCHGYCGPAGDNCCKAGKTKKRRVKMRCRDGKTHVTTVDIIRRCECSTTCAAPRSFLLK